MPTTLRTIVGRSGWDEWANIPWKQWTLLTTVAIVGSSLYGASLSAVLPAINVIAGAEWLALSAGLAWIVFVPWICCSIRVSLIYCLHVALITMAGGEVILLSGTIVNLFLRWNHLTAHAALVNCMIVGISNIVMACLLARQLRVIGVPVGKTLTLWIIGLNVPGAFFFAFFYRMFFPA